MLRDLAFACLFKNCKLIAQLCLISEYWQNWGLSPMILTSLINSNIVKPQSVTYNYFENVDISTTFRRKYMRASDVTGSPAIMTFKSWWIVRETRMLFIDFAESFDKLVNSVWMQPATSNCSDNQSGSNWNALFAWKFNSSRIGGTNSLGDCF